MEKKKYYYKVRFPARVIEEAHDLFLKQVGGMSERDIEGTNFGVDMGDEGWSFDSREEFLAEYPKADACRFDHIAGRNRIIVTMTGNKTTSVLASSPNRVEIESIFAVFERNVDASRIVVPTEPIKVFVGHGRDRQWRDLKDHLHEHHGFEVVAYEIGPRAGLSVKEVLQTMLNRSSFALLVLTGEDLHADGELHARENVIHELGLFQGKVGFRRAIALLEEGVKEFSNILGINQIRFRKGNIRETFGDVLATVKREMEGEESGV